MADVINVPWGTDIVAVPGIYGINSSGGKVATVGTATVDDFIHTYLIVAGTPPGPRALLLVWRGGVSAMPSDRESLVTVTLHLTSSDGADIVKVLTFIFGPNPAIVATGIHTGDPEFLTQAGWVGWTSNNYPPTTQGVDLAEGPGGDGVSNW